jgi:hypothetical protein
MRRCDPALRRLTSLIKTPQYRHRPSSSYVLDGYLDSIWWNAFDAI